MRVLYGGARRSWARWRRRPTRATQGHLEMMVVIGVLIFQVSLTPEPGRWGAVLGAVPRGSGGQKMAPEEAAQKTGDWASMSHIGRRRASVGGGLTRISRRSHRGASKRVFPSEAAKNDIDLPLVGFSHAGRVCAIFPKAVDHRYARRYVRSLDGVLFWLIVVFFVINRAARL